MFEITSYISKWLLWKLVKVIQADRESGHKHSSTLLSYGVNYHWNSCVKIYT